MAMVRVCFYVSFSWMGMAIMKNGEMLMEFDRKTYIGGSDVAAILGVSPWKSQFQLYQEKIGAWEQEVSAEKEKIFARGKRWEPVVIEMLVDELESLGHVVEVIGRNQRYRDQEHDFIAAEIDLELLIDGEEVNGEMKTVHPFAAKDWGEQESDEFPIYYQAQVMHGLMVKPRKRAVVAALIGADDLRVHWLERDEETIAGIRERELDFWRRVQERYAPDPATNEDVSWLYRADKGGVSEASEEIMQIVERLQGIKSGLKLLEEEKELAQIKVKSWMGDNATLIYEGMPVLTWKNNKSSVKTDYESVVFDLPQTNQLIELIKVHTTNKPGARVFRLK